jgi:hypothetical protein
VRRNSLDGVGSPQFRPEQSKTIAHTHTDNSGEFWFVRDAGMRARRQTGSDWSHTQHQQSTVGHRYVNTRSWLRTHCHTRTSTITDLLLHHHSKSVTYVRSCSFLSRAFYTIPNPCVNEWVSECSDGRIADAIRHVSMWRKDPNRIIKSLSQKGETCFCWLQSHQMPRWFFTFPGLLNLMLRLPFKSNRQLASCLIVMKKCWEFFWRGGPKVTIEKEKEESQREWVLYRIPVTEGPVTHFFYLTSPSSPTSLKCHTS